MKELTTYNRAAGYLNKIFDLLNAEYFGGQLDRPVLSIQSTPKAYGHFTLNAETWISKNGSAHEINLGAGTLSRPIEELVATTLHEMVHYFCYVNGIKDTSNRGVYHNKRFKQVAESVGLIVEHHPTYGWTITSPSDDLIQFCLDNDLTEILINRNEGYGIRPTGTGTHSGSPTPTTTAVPTKSSYRRYVCPRCGLIVRATKEVRVACMDCEEQLILDPRR